MVNGTQEVISMLSNKESYNDLGLCAMRLEVLAESAMSNDAIPLEALDAINKAVHLLQSSINGVTRYDPYQAQLENDE